MTVVSQRRTSDVPFIGALRRLRDPLLLFALPVTFALLLIFAGYAVSWPIGFDFRGTLWEPARALLDGSAVYPEPTRDAVLLGNPTVYPPVFVLASIPLALLPVTLASWLWFGVLGACFVAAVWMVGVRDWRCHVIAVTSPVVIHGLFYGNLTVLLVLPLAIAWRYRSRARTAGLAVGVAVAAKLFVWPLIVWLLLTRRFRAAIWAVGSAAALVLGSWTLIGFEGFVDYPALLRTVQDVYAVRSVSIPTVVGSVGASVEVGVGVAAIAGISLLVLAALLVGREAGDRRAFAVVVAACVVASPIVWPNYAALLFVPIAVTWPRLAPAWFFGYAVWLAGALAPNPAAPDAGVRPTGVPEQAWLWSHVVAEPWFAAGMMAVTLGVTALLVFSRRQRVA
jgi:hypothetical protein